MQKTKVIGLDIYGTVLCTNDPENALGPRKGFIEFINAVRRVYPDIKIVTVSDANLDLLKIDLQDSGVDLKIFDNFFEMKKTGPKDFSTILIEFSIQPSELLVIGDNLERDCGSAISIGARAIHVPEYENASDEFDLSSLSLA